MKTILLLPALLMLGISFSSPACEVGPGQAGKAAQTWLASRSDNITLKSEDPLIIRDEAGRSLAYRFSLEPAGYLVMAADTDLPPVIAYSFLSSPEGPAEVNPLDDIVAADMVVRFSHVPLMEVSRLQEHRRKWEELIAGHQQKALFEQWPPPGSTSTGGWLETNWSQSAPYNSLCPLDEVTGLRSVAGCPAIALAMIIHYQKTLNGTTFSDEDDYYHSYSGRQYWIDDDHHEMDFPSFPLLNVYFTSIAGKFADYKPLETEEISALVFACGVAARQVYTSSVSGTFGVDQAYDAYQRFGYADALLIYDSDTSFYTHLRNNMMDGIPVHLALLSSTGQGGHNVVTDGYNTDDYYHLNFGWGGSYNGWYLLPDEIPYNLTIVEGAIMDIGISHVGLKEPAKAENFDLKIFPNPSAGDINIRLSVNEADNVDLSVHSADGRFIGTIFSGTLNAGRHLVHFDEGLPPGLYYVTARNRHTTASKAFVINR